MKQLNFFQMDDPLLEEIRDQIMDLDIDHLTLWMLLNSLRKKLGKKKFVVFGKIALHLLSNCESSSGVEHHLAKVRVRVQIPSFAYPIELVDTLD